MTDVELLAPAGDREKLEAALRFGADAVYMGGPMLQLRAGSTGFELDDLASAIARVHQCGRRAYVTFNAFAYDDDFAQAIDYAQALHAMHADAVIVSDLGLMRAVRRAAPSLSLHVSTQANCMNAEAARMYADMGASRIVLARELSLERIRRLRDLTPPQLELEAFIHGAMCMAYSGRCMISAHLTGRSANRGGCTQPCRWNYALTEEKRPGQFFPIEEDARGMAVLSSRDLCALPLLDELCAAGVRSFKIEGRMKSAYYVATVVGAYRRALDATAGRSALMHELESINHRPYCTGFYLDEADVHRPDGGKTCPGSLFVGVVTQNLGSGCYEFEVRNRFQANDRLEVLSPASLGLSFRACDLRDAEGEAIPAARVPGERCTLTCPHSLIPGDMLRLPSES